MTQRRVENTRAHFWTFSPVSVKREILSVGVKSAFLSKEDLTRFKLAQMSCEKSHARIVRPSDNGFVVTTQIERKY